MYKVKSFSRLVSHLFPLALLVTALIPTAHGQAPGLTWSTSVGSLIGLDSQTNVYALPTGTVGTIAKLNSAGTLLLTNKMCPIPSIGAVDGAGNFYFSGTLSGTTSFSGTNVSGMAAIAKYNSAGTLIWARGLLPTFLGYNSFGVGSLQVDPSGVAWVSCSGRYEEDQYASYDLFRCDDAGNTDIGLAAPPSFFEYHVVGTGVGTVSPTNAYAIAYESASGLNVQVTASIATTNGANALAYWQQANRDPMPSTVTPISDRAGNVYNAEYQTLTKRSATSGTLIWSVDTGNSNLRTIAGDFYGGVHIADDSGLLARYDSAGNLAWSTNLHVRCNAMFVDSQGNRFISTDDGKVSRMQAELVAPPVITNAPTGGTIFSGSNFSFSVGATGFTPFSYYWLYQSNGLALPSVLGGATTATFTLTNAMAAQSGLYSVIVSNLAGTATSAPVTLQVDAVGFFTNSHFLTAGTYFFASPTTVSIQSAFTNGSTYYTLDGSTPGFSSTFYSGPFVLSNNATLKAIGYNSDFSQSAFSETITVTVPPQYTLTATTAGGGTVGLNPPGGTYASNAVVMATATPASGWSFLYWQGAVSSTDPVISVTMQQSEAIQAVFGTTLSVTATSGGQSFLVPSGGVYAYGTTVRLEALPQAGYYFGTWGNAAAGKTTNPLYFTVTNANQSISSVFASTGSNQVSLAVLIIGQGQVGVSPSGNVFTNGQGVTITATPASGQSFVKWTGSASGTQNPLTVTLNQSEVITANFTGQTAQVAPGSTAYGPGGFTFTLNSDPQSVYQIQVSTNLGSTNWQILQTVTNVTGQMPVTDPGATNSKSRFYRALQQ